MNIQSIKEPYEYNKDKMIIKYAELAQVPAPSKRLCLNPLF
jgi:hypothetical protein